MSESNIRDIETKASNAIVALVDFFSSLHARDKAREVHLTTAIDQAAMQIKHFGEELAKRDRKVAEMQGVFAAAMQLEDECAESEHNAKTNPVFRQIIGEIIEEAKKVRASRAGQR